MAANRKNKPPYQTPLLTKLDELNGVKGDDDYEFGCDPTGSSAEEGCKDGGIAHGGWGCDSGNDANN